MKSARLSRFGVPADVIELIEVPDPPPPGADQVLVDVLACPTAPRAIPGLR